MFLPIITANEVLTLREQNHVAYIYPRKHEVHVDGHKRYQITSGSMDMVKHYNNGKLN